jgi:hypothetical protein
MAKSSRLLLKPDRTELEPSFNVFFLSKQGALEKQKQRSPSLLLPEVFIIFEIFSCVRTPKLQGSDLI